MTKQESSLICHPRETAQLVSGSQVAATATSQDAAWLDDSATMCKAVVVGVAGCPLLQQQNL